MVKHAKKERGRQAVRHVRLHHWLLDSSAWLDLSPKARSLYVEISKLFNGLNNGDLFLSVRDAATRLGVAKDTANKAFQELEDHGFIKPKQKGSFHWKQSMATSWIITEHGYGDKLASKEFVSWKSENSRS